MSESFDVLSDEHQRFLVAQKVFFVATAGAEGLSPARARRDMGRRRGYRPVPEWLAGRDLHFGV